MKLLLAWLRFQALVDLGAGVALLLLPATLLGLLGLHDVAPVFGRVIGVVALSLAAGYGLAAERPQGDALTVANLTRAASALALGSAAVDSSLPWLLRSAGAGELSFLLLTLFLARRAL